MYFVLLGKIIGNEFWISFKRYSFLSYTYLNNAINLYNYKKKHLGNMMEYIKSMCTKKK